MGDTILGNRYKIEKKIGEGGMAYVYEAKDKLLNRVVAVKVLRPEFVDDQEFLKKFKREAEAVASLSHPNIVNVYDVGEDGKVHYIVMEYVNGKNLKEIIQEEGTLDEYTALDISKQIAMALSCAHKRGIIHRDIKPHNILISNEGRNIAKVADFGIAKAVSNSTMTNIGGVIGSVHYFSPEQAKGKFVTNNADLYSLGIVLYEMLTGKVPFRGDTPVSIALQHINDDIEFTEEEKIRIPQSVRTIIKKLTEKNTADRYQTAEEVIEDIEYIEKNIDLDFIKEYDDFATRHIDERNLNSVAKPKIVPAAIADIDGDDAGYYDDEEYDDDDYYDEEDEEDYIPKKRRKKKKKKVIQEETPKTRKKLKIAAVILSLILLAQVGVFFKLFGSSIFGSKDAIIAPNVEGMQVTQAETTVEDMGLNLKIVSYEYSYSAAENEIISQDPDAGTELKEGDTITVVVSKGNNNKEEPNVVGMTLSQAQGMIQAKGFAVGKITYEYSSAYKEGTVLAQSNSGGKISLVVSKGEDKENKPTLPNEDNNNTNNNNNNGNTGNDNTGGGSSGGGSDNTGGGSSGGGSDNTGGGSSGGGSDNSGGGSSGGGSDNTGGGSSGGGESSGGATE